MVLSVIKRRRQMVPHAHARHTATSTTVLCHGETFGGTPEKMQLPRQQEAPSQAAPGWRGPTENNAGKEGPSGSGCCSCWADRKELKPFSGGGRCPEPSPAVWTWRERGTIPNLGNLSRI